MIDINSRNKGVAGRLSNFQERSFWFYGIFCVCPEGPIQAFKFDNPVEQQRICLLSGRDAKKRGQERNEIWQSKQLLWWMGMEYPRHSREYQELLNRLYISMLTLQSFQDDLLATGEEKLIHSIGESDPTQTVLTELELCSRLEWSREFFR
ncbi:hypothetical protein ACFL2R_04405, partial [Patescibacteria group bacterium]